MTGKFSAAVIVRGTLWLDGRGWESHPHGRSIAVVPVDPDTLEQAGGEDDAIVLSSNDWAGIAKAARDLLGAPRGAQRPARL